jgi:hypothetical protein
MIEIYKNTKIFVACPANAATGGPELLHQLVYHLRKDLNIDAFMYYYNFDNRRFETPIHPEYKMYGNPFVTNLNEIEDNKKNIIIVPEVQEGLNLLQLFKNIRKGVWFLSVDYYYLSKVHEKMLFLGFNKLDLLSNKIEKLAIKFPYEKDPLLKLADFYMTNSYRGLKWFSNLKPMYYLPDYYVNIRFIEESYALNLNNKKNIVAYNPNKGYLFTKKIIEFADGIKFIPIRNMTREDVINLLKEAKVYIDFGYFPGPERIPKEAAILGCCVITGKRGSAGFYEDVPIPNEYKFENKEENIPKIIDKIKDCFENYEEKYKDFEYYREVIKNGPQRFIEDLKKIFVKV